MPFVIPVEEGPSLRGQNLERCELDAVQPIDGPAVAAIRLHVSIYVLSPSYRRHLKDNLRQAGYVDARTRREAIAAAGRMLFELPPFVEPHRSRDAWESSAWEGGGHL